MCAEFTPGQGVSAEALLEAGKNILPVIKDIIRERVFPHGLAPIVVAQNDSPLVVNAEFGLVPEWWNRGMNQGKSKSNRPLFATYNCRLEGITQKKSFKKSFQDRHCVVPMSFFFESALFGKYPGTRLQVSSPCPLLAAGIYSDWLDKDSGELVTTFSVITHDPPMAIFEAGHDRCPIFLEPKSALHWLFLKGEKESLDFCHTQGISKSIPYEFAVDRKLKAGWEKRAPSAEEIQQIKILS